MGKAQEFSASGTIFPVWGAVAYDLGIIVVGNEYSSDVRVLNIASNTWSTVTNVTGQGYFRNGAGGVYVIQNHTIAVADPRNTNSSIYKLSIPVSGNAYNPAGQWVWTKMNPSGPSPASFEDPGSNNSANSKFNIVEDMGNGQSAIIFLPNIHGPIYVYKVPINGL